MTLVRLSNRVPGPFAGAKVETVTFGGQTFRAGRRTIAHLLWTQQQLTKVHPGCVIHVMQPCYHVGYPPSAGTHDGDGVLDVAIEGDMGAPDEAGHWLAAQGFFRAHGWDAWWRHTGTWAAESEWHVHMISDGCPGPVGDLIPQQVEDYYHHAEGLAGEHTQGDDPTWHPKQIAAKRFDYAAWRKADQTQPRVPAKPRKGNK